MANDAAKIAESLVRRDRAGDQNAHALIILCKKSADKGSKRSKEVLAAIVKYCSDYPVKGSSPGFGGTAEAVIPHQLTGAAIKGLSYLKGLVSFSGDVADEDLLTHCSQLLVSLPVTRPTTEVATVLLADGAPLTVPRIQCLAGALNNEDAQKLFKLVACGFPVPKDLPPQAVPVVHAGDIVGKARALQLARRPGNPLAPLSPAMGYEFGEE